MTTTSNRRKKTPEEILNQIERILNLYLQGYGSSKRLLDCEAKVYVIIGKFEY